MPTEDDLRVAFRDLERFTPDAADVLRAVYDHPRRPEPLAGDCGAGRGGMPCAQAWPWAQPGRWPRPR